MVKESLNVDFYTTGRQPEEKDFARISEWIKKQKKRPRQESGRFQL
jgi:hypothetical protein